MPYEARAIDVNFLASFPDYDDHERVIRCEDASSGMVAFVAVHDTTLGPGMGGCRMQPYGSEADAIRDALRLSRGMTYKYALAELDYGGAKAVIVDKAGGGIRSDRIRAFAEFVERLGGLYTTAEDAGIGTADIRSMSEVTSHVRNLPMDDAGDGALCTAWGVLHGIEAGLEFRGLGRLDGRKVAVEGLGKVGMTLCSLLRSKGADLVVYDVDGGKVSEAATCYGAVVASPGRIHAADADVYSPCALGAVLNAETVPDIRAAVVAGAANNQLGDSESDAHLHHRGIIYCPDYVVNAGGVLSVADKGLAYDRGVALERVARIRKTSLAVLESARAQDIPTGVAADQMAQRRIAGRRRYSTGTRADSAMVIAHRMSSVSGKSS